MINQPSPDKLAPPLRGLALLKTILYILAGLMLLLGLIAGLGLLAGAGGIVSNLVLPLEMIGFEAGVNLVRPLLSGLLINLGIAALLVTLALSGLLYGVGRLVGHIQRLELRIARLEAGAASLDRHNS